MTEDEFAYLRDFLRRRSGLSLGLDKLYLAESRLGPVCHDAGFASLGDLVRALRAGGEETISQRVVDAMTTNETTFFRDGIAFDALRTVVLPRLIEARASTRRLRIWSAACSTGQEAYSVAMLLGEMSPRLKGWQVTILGTDVSQRAVDRARSGLYSPFEVQRGLPIRLLLRHFSQSPEGWTISAAMRRSVSFRAQNLLDDFASLGRFDLILCRNLLIYLDLETKKTLLTRLAPALAVDGALCLGASETVLGLSDMLAPDPDARGFSVRGEPGVELRFRATG